MNETPFRGSDSTRTHMAAKKGSSRSGKGGAGVNGRARESRAGVNGQASHMEFWPACSVSEAVNILACLLCL